VDDLLGVLAEVAGSGGDGALFVRRIAGLLAHDVDARFPSCAAYGPTADGRGAVLVYGSATAEVTTVAGVIALSAADAVTAVDRLFPTTADEVRLTLPTAIESIPDSRVRLDGGVVSAGGAVFSTSATGYPIASPLPHRTVAPPGQWTSLPVVAAPEPVQPAAVGVIGEADPYHAVGQSVPEPWGATAPFVGSGGGAARTAGSLIVDDGTRVELDADYLIGREPQHDPEVVAGACRPLRIIDHEGVVSRKHVRISVVGVEVRITDLSSANGTWVQAPGEPVRTQLLPDNPVLIPPGTVITLGRRTVVYEATRD
jgi:hypothetical protein